MTNSGIFQVQGTIGLLMQEMERRTDIPCAISNIARILMALNVGDCSPDEALEHARVLYNCSKQQYEVLK